VISRQWKGIARKSDADRYVAHLQEETFPRLSKISGFVDASILRREVQDGVEFLIVTRWESIEAIRKFAGETPERAVVPEAVQSMMVSYDRVVAHYEVVSWR
jgi:heme-degrading monooxygenase HmoA